MIPAVHPYEAVYEGRMNRPVVAWDDNGHPLVVSKNRLTRADHVPGFLAVQESDQTVAALPPGKWVALYKDGGKIWNTPLVGWAVQRSGTVLPLVVSADGEGAFAAADSNFDSVHHPAWDDLA